MNTTYNTEKNINFFEENVKKVKSFHSGNDFKSIRYVQYAEWQLERVKNDQNPYAVEEWESEERIKIAPKTVADYKKKYTLENVEELENKEGKKYYIFMRGLVSTPWGAYVVEGGKGNEGKPKIEEIDWIFSRSSEDRETYHIVLDYFKKKYKNFL